MEYALLQTKRHQEIVPKLLEGAVTLMLQYVHEPAYKFLLQLKMLAFNCNVIILLVKLKIKCTKWLLKPDWLDQETCLEL